jgi:hypothetical protein
MLLQVFKKIYVYNKLNIQLQIDLAIEENYSFRCRYRHLLRPHSPSGDSFCHIRFRAMVGVGALRYKAATLGLGHGEVEHRTRYLQSLLVPVHWLRDTCRM